jgi:hypothetical protein
MAKLNLLQIATARKGKFSAPQELEGVEKMLVSFGLCNQAKEWGMDFSLLVFGIGQKLLQAVSETAFLAELELSGLQKRFNRFLRKNGGENLLPWLLQHLPKKCLQDPDGVLILDDTPLQKSGKKMPGAKKFFHNGQFFHGYELLTLIFSGEKGLFPLGSSLKTKTSLSKITMACHLIEQTLSLGFSPRWIVFDSWYTVKKLLDFIILKGLRFVGPLKKNRVLWFQGRRHHLDYFLKKSQGRTYCAFLISLKKNEQVLRLVVFQRRLKSGKIQTEFLLTNDLTSAAKKIAKVYLKRWGIETLFRAGKQTFSLEKFHNRNFQAIQNHIAFSLCAMVLVAFMKTLFKSLRGKSLAFVRRVAFFKKITVTIGTRWCALKAFAIRPNPLYFKRFGVVAWDV